MIGSLGTLSASKLWHREASEQSLHVVLDAIGRQSFLDRAADTLNAVVSRGLETVGGGGTRGLRNFLHGTWLGHPLHPLLTDVALGSWTAAVTIDLINDLLGDDVLPGANTAIAIGLLGAVGSAATGAADWQQTYGAPRRIGVAHAGINVVATLLMDVSFATRLMGCRSSGRWLGRAGFGLAAVSAYIGGDLVYRHRIGVNHAQDATEPQTFTPALPESELEEGRPKLVELEGVRIVLVRHGDEIHALGEVCSHLGGPLSEGKIEDGGIVCPWHSSRFALESGRVLDGPATFPQPCFETRVRSGKVEVRAPSA